MARDAHAREDLLRDARALAPRIMLRVELGGRLVDVLAGFRGEALSLYFGDDPVFHFNPRGELRRAFVDDQLIKAEGGRLVALTPRRSQERTELESRLLGQDEERHLLENMTERIRSVAEALQSRRFEILGEEPKEGHARVRLEQWLAEGRQLSVARSPSINVE